jgi:hypothetical protein
MTVPRIVGVFLRRRPATRSGSPRHPSTRLRLEPLEDRTAPANFTAANAAELIAATDAANLTPEADTITLAAGKTFTLTAANNSTEGATGLPVIAPGSTVSILGNGDVVERSSASGTPEFRLFCVAAGGSLTLTNLTLQGGVLDSDVGVLYSVWGSFGGAILNRGQLNLTGVTVQNNVARGSSWFADHGYSRAGGGAAGGAVYSSGDLIMSGCTIRNNSAVGGRGSDGAAYYNGNIEPGSHPPQPGKPGGYAHGGGLCIAAGTANITGSTFEQNLAKGGEGGKGMKSDGGAVGGTGGDAFGGSVYVGEGTASIHNTTIVMSQANGGVGGKGGGRAPTGAKGVGKGGGIFIAPAAFVGLDPFTVNHVKNNQASTANNNISGDYDLIS